MFRLLIVDDNPRDTALLRNLLKGLTRPYEAYYCRSSKLRTSNKIRWLRRTVAMRPVRYDESEHSDCRHGTRLLPSILHHSPSSRPGGRVAPPATGRFQTQTVATSLTTTRPIVLGCPSPLVVRMG